VLLATFETLVKGFEVEFAEGVGNGVGDGLTNRFGFQHIGHDREESTMKMLSTMRFPSSSARRVAGTP